MAVEPAQEEVFPASFAELPAAGADAACRVCGGAASHRMQLVVRIRPGKGAGRAAHPCSIADHKQDYCEAHAVALFVKIKKAMR